MIFFIVFKVHQILWQQNKCMNSYTLASSSDVAFLTLISLDAMDSKWIPAVAGNRLPKRDGVNALMIDRITHENNKTTNFMLLFY